MKIKATRTQPGMKAAEVACPYNSLPCSLHPKHWAAPALLFWLHLGLPWLLGHRGHREMWLLSPKHTPLLSLECLFKYKYFSALHFWRTCP